MTTATNMIGAIRSVGVVEKKGRNDFHKYSFRRADDVYAAVQPAIIENGLIPKVEIIDHEHSVQTNNRGAPVVHSIVRLRLTFLDTTGNPVTSVETIGESMDTGDKSYNKALTMAMKAALCFAFMIPAAGDSDTENESHELSPTTKTKGKRKTASKTGTPAGSTSATSPTDGPSNEARELAAKIRAATSAAKCEAFELDIAMWKDDREKQWLLKILDKKIESMTGEIRDRIQTTAFPVAD